MKQRHDILTFLHRLRSCLRLSFEASSLFTMLRLLLHLLGPLSGIAFAFVGKGIIDLLAQSDGSQLAKRQLLLWLIGFLALSLLRLLQDGLGSYVHRQHDELIQKHISVELMQRALQMDLCYFDKTQHLDRLHAASRDSHALLQIIWGLTRFLSALLSYGLSFVLLSHHSLLNALLLSLAALPAAIVASHYTKSLYHLSLEQLQSQRELNYDMGLAMNRQMAQDLRLFGAGPRLLQNYLKRWQEQFDARKDMRKRKGLHAGFLASLPEFCAVLILLRLTWQVLHGEGTVGDYALYSGLLAQLKGSIDSLIHSGMELYENRMKLEQFFGLKDFHSQIEDQGTLVLKAVEDIHFEKVSFAYPGCKDKALDEITLSLQKGHPTALIGLNGSGKSSLIKLLLRFYEPDAGKITINGKPLAAYSLASLRQCFSVYFQEMQNFPYSLRDNFLFTEGGTAQASEQSDQKIRAILETAQAGDILAKAEQSLDRMLSRLFDPEGLVLSIGQAQKFALARCLYRPHEVLILDEVSSNLDPEAEHRLFIALEEHCQNKLALFTSHRLSKLGLAQQIVVMEKGRIVEAGSLDSLLAQEQRFATLFAYQKQGDEGKKV